MSDFLFSVEQDGRKTHLQYIEGQEVDSHIGKKSDSFSVETPEGINIGRFVARGTEGQSCVVLSADTKAGDVLGITALKHGGVANRFAPLQRDWLVGSVAAVNRAGAFAMVAHGGCTAGDPVHVLKVATEDYPETGVVFGEEQKDGETVITFELQNVHFERSAADGELAPILIGYNMGAK